MSKYRSTRDRQNLNKACYSGIYSEGPFDTPVLRPVRDEWVLSLRWLPFNYAYSVPDYRKRDVGIHFFLDDYQFERVWKEPERYAEMLSKFGAVCTPDFSIYNNWPNAIRYYNHYRSHWMGRFWQDLGLTVIPSVNWSYESSWEWCFKGDPKDSIVATSSTGAMSNDVDRQMVRDGFDEMVRQLHPRRILWRGKLPEGLNRDDFVFIESQVNEKGTGTLKDRIEGRINVAKGDDKSLGGGSGGRIDPREQYLDMEGNEFLKQQYETYRAKAEMSEAEMKQEAEAWGMTLDQYKEYVRNQIEQALEVADMNSNPETKKKAEQERKAKEEANAKKKAAESSKKPDPGWAERYLGQKGHNLDTLEKTVMNLSKDEILRRFPDMGLTKEHSKTELVSMILTNLQNRGYKQGETNKSKWKNPYST